MNETHTSYEVSKRLKEFLGESAPEPVNCAAPWIDKSGRHWFVKEEAEASGEEVAYVYQLHDLLSKPFTNAMFEKIGVVEMTDTDMGIEDDYDVFLKISYSYYEGGLPAVEKALMEMMK